MILYVDNLVGNDSNNGSAAFPLASIDAATNIASETEETEIILIPTKTNYQISNTAILKKQIYMHSKGKSMIEVDINFYYCIGSFHRYQYLNINFKKAYTGNDYNITINTESGCENKFEDCRIIDKTKNGSVIWRNSPIYFKNCVIQGFTGTFTSYPTSSVNVSVDSCENVAFIDCRNVSSVSNSKNLLFINSPCTNYPTDSIQYIIDNAAQDEFINVDGIMYGAFLHFKKCLLLQDGNYYSVNEDFYQNGSFSPLNVVNLSDSIEEDGFFDMDLVTPCNIDGDVFVPLTKFNHFKLVTSKESGIIIKGIKRKTELVVASDDIDITIARNIDNFTLLEEENGNGKIKVALSIDRGERWFTWDDTTLSFVLLAVSINTKKDFSLLTDQEKIDWYNAADEIIKNGIDCNTFNRLDFNLLSNNTDTGKLENLRFAYALERPLYTDNVITNNLKWQFDAMGTMRLMDNTECQIDISGRKVSVKSLINSPIMKINTLI